MDHLSQIKEQFAALFKSKQRGSTLEIMTPFATTNRKFVSVFISTQDNELVVSDGGWVHGGFYGLKFKRMALSNFDLAFAHYADAFSIEQTTGPDGTIYHYKKTTDALHVPSLALDVASFITGIVSFADSEITPK